MVTTSSMAEPKIQTVEERKKVLYVIDTLTTGGAEKSILEICSRLKQFYPVICIVFEKNPDLREEFISRGIELIELRVRSQFWWIAGARKLKKVIEQHKPDLVHATLFKSELITRVALLGTGVPHIGSFVNDSYSKNRYKNQSSIRNLKLNIIRFFDWLTSKTVYHYMSITNAIAVSNAKALNISPKKITCIYRGRTIDSFVVEHPPIEGSPFIFLTVARLLLRKGYPELLTATKILKEKGYSFVVKIAGEGADYTKLVSMAHSLGVEKEVFFLMTQKNIPSLLAGAHCFVFPSHYEGQGGALVEAMLAAKPIIASDIEVFKEQITHDKTGILFQVFNSEDLAEKMEWMMLHYKEGVEMGIRSRTVAIERFNIENTALEHEKLYSKILNAHAAFTN